MPCNSDHLAATHLEASLSQVLCLIHEFNTRQPVSPGLPEWRGYHPDAYGAATMEKLDKATARLCALLEIENNVQSYSLEMQVWWRDHQEWDRRRNAEIAADIEREAARKSGLAKLTPDERRALGLRDSG